MQFTLNISSTRVAAYLPHLARAVISLSFLSAASTAFAESAYIQQTAPGSAPKTQVFTPVSDRPDGNFVRSNIPASFVPTPELAAPNTRGSNFAQSVTVGNFNTIAQLQGGRNDASAVSVLGGNHDNVGVLQGGNNLRSNIALLGMQGMNVTVLQGANSAPVNMLIARLQNGAILIKR